MGDAGEGLIDAEDRIQERIEDAQRTRADRRAARVHDPRAIQELESLRLAKAELQNQLDSTVHPQRRAHLSEALAEIERRTDDVQARLG
jgi:ABC-type phosphate transport system auxiliary subunit